VSCTQSRSQWELMRISALSARLFSHWRLHPVLAARQRNQGEQRFNGNFSHQMKRWQANWLKTLHLGAARSGIRKVRSIQRIGLCACSGPGSISCTSVVLICSGCSRITDIASTAAPCAGIQDSIAYWCE